MAKDPSARFATAGEARAALEACMARNDARAPAPPTKDPAPPGLGRPGPPAGLGLAAGRRRDGSRARRRGWLLLVPPELRRSFPAQLRRLLRIHSLARRHHRPLRLATLPTVNRRKPRRA